MSVEDILQWGEAHQYPGLVLGPGQQLRHVSPERLAAVVARIERWNTIEQKTEVA